MVKAGIKVNVIPSQATALINHRVHPADTVDEVVQYDKGGHPYTTWSEKGEGVHELTIAQYPMLLYFVTIAITFTLT